MRALTALALTLVVGLACAQDKSPEPAKSRPQVAQPKPKADQRGTEFNPIFVKGDVSTKKTAEEAAADADERKEKAAADKALVKYARLSVLIAFVMLLVAVVQAFFFWWQLRMLSRTTASAKEAAAAALLQAKAAVGIELPVLRAIPTELASIDAPLPVGGLETPYGASGIGDVPDRYSVVGWIEFKNYGRTPAFPAIFESGWKVARTLPELPTYDHTVRASHAAVIEPAGSFTIGLHRTIELTEQQIRAIAADEAWLWFYGCLTYRDFLGDERKFRFCWRWARRNVADSGRYFLSDGEPPASYVVQSFTRAEGGGYV